MGALDALVYGTGPEAGRDGYEITCWECMGWDRGDRN